MPEPQIKTLAVARGSYSPPSPQQFDAAIEALRRGASIPVAAAIAQINPRTFRNRLDRDESLRDRVEAAQALAAQPLIESARKLALGVETPVWHGGEIVGVESKVTPKVLLYLLSKVPGFEDRKTITHEGEVKHIVEDNQNTLTAATLARLSPAAQAEVGRAWLLQGAPQWDDDVKSQRLIEYVGHCRTIGIEIPLEPLAREMRIGKFAHEPLAIETQYEEVDSEPEIEDFL